MSLHVGIIMDGNGRWATNQNLPRLAGHKAGIEAVVELVRACPDIGVDTITLFAFAIANWKRDTEEVDGLWELFHIFFTQQLQVLLDEGVHVRVIGNREGLPEQVLTDIKQVEEQSKDNTKFLLQVALNYDGVEEVARMMQKTLTENVAPEKIPPQYVLDNLDTVSDNQPDIVVRTGMPAKQGKYATWRSSAFLPLQSAQSVCISTEILWPDFTSKHMEEIIEYADPDSRLFGGQRK